MWKLSSGKTENDFEVCVGKHLAEQFENTVQYVAQQLDIQLGIQLNDYAVFLHKQICL